MFQPPLLVILIVFIVPGIWTGQINPLLVTVRHERIPAELRGRVFSTFSAITAIAQPVGMVTFGFLLENAGLNVAIFVLGFGELLAAVMMIFLPWMKDLDARRPVQLEEVAREPSALRTG